MVETQQNVSSADRGTKRGFGLPRLVGQLWGTNNLGDIRAALKHLIDRRELVQGPVIEVYEREFARTVGVRHAISFASGRLAFYGLLRALGIQPGDEVLLQLPTHIVVANAIRYVGAKPVYVDCDLDTYNMDLEQAEERITPRTKALLLQHTFGIPANPDQAVELARRHNLILIEDCVHALGATFQGKQVGSFGKAAFFSTEETKIISSMMGGMAVTDDDELAEKLRAFQQECQWPAPGLAARYIFKLVAYHFIGHPYVHHLTRPIYLFMRRFPVAHLAPGATSHSEMKGDLRSGILPKNYALRLTNAQAEIALRQLRRLNENLAHRHMIAAEYEKRLSRLGFHTPRIPAGAEPSFVRYPVWVGDRADAMRKAAPHAVLGQWFNTVLEESTSPSSGNYPSGTCPRAEAAAIHLTNVPTHPRVTMADVDAIAHALAATPRGQPELNLQIHQEMAQQVERIKA